jgi:hypothetical protein
MLVFVLNPTVAVPVVIDDAIRAEAERTGLRRHEVLTDWFVRTWPDYVARNLRRDLGGSGEIIDVTAEDVTPRTKLLRSDNDAPEWFLRGADELAANPVVELNSTARRRTEGASGARAT